MTVRDGCRVEALAVVADPEDNRRAAAVDGQLDLACRRVLDDVVERLLGDPVEDLLDRERQPLRQVARDDDREADPALERRRMGPQGGQQPVLLEVPGPQLEDQGPHLGQCLALEVAERGQLLAGRRRVAIDEELRASSDEGHAEQRLGHRVVQLAGEMGPLLAGRKLAGLAAEVALEALALGDVAGRAVDPGEGAVDRRPDRADLDGDGPAVLLEEIELDDLARRR